MLLPLIAILLTFIILLGFAKLSPQSSAKVINHPALMHQQEVLNVTAEETEVSSSEQA